MPQTKHDRSMPTRTPERRSPCCRQFRAARGTGGYPISGYCALATAPGALMIPSVEEYRTLCTTLAFRHCPWFEAPQRVGAPAVAPRDVWTCPTLRWSRTSD